MARDTVSHTLLVATVLCVACSVLVSGAAVGLRERQETNKQLDRMHKHMKHFDPDSYSPSLARP